MIFDHIETLKKQYTDKYVVVDESQAELRRFRGLTGTVKTVNMSGRALVEFDGHNNIGWYDIDPTFLKVIDAPLPKPEEPAAKKKEAAPKAEAKPAAKPAAPATAKPAAPAAGKSVAEILAAARTKPGAAPAAEAPKPAAAPAAKAPPSGKGMSMAEILAAARANKGGAAAPAAAAPPAAKAAPAVAAPEPAPAAEEPAAVAAPEPATATGGVKSLKDKYKTVAEQIAYCRKIDAK